MMTTNQKRLEGRPGPAVGVEQPEQHPPRGSVLRPSACCAIVLHPQPARPYRPAAAHLTVSVPVMFGWTVQMNFTSPAGSAGTSYVRFAGRREDRRPGRRRAGRRPVMSMLWGCRVLVVEVDLEGLVGRRLEGRRVEGEFVADDRRATVRPVPTAPARRGRRGARDAAASRAPAPGPRRRTRRSSSPGTASRPAPACSSGSRQPLNVSTLPSRGRSRVRTAPGRG